MTSKTPRWTYTLTTRRQMRQRVPKPTRNRHELHRNVHCSVLGHSRHLCRRSGAHVKNVLAHHQNSAIPQLPLQEVASCTRSRTIQGFSHVRRPRRSHVRQEPATIGRGAWLRFCRTPSCRWPGQPSSDHSGWMPGLSQASSLLSPVNKICEGTSILCSAGTLVNPCQESGVDSIKKVLKSAKCPDSVYVQRGFFEVIVSSVRAAKEFSRVMRSDWSSKIAFAVISWMWGLSRSLSPIQGSSAPWCHGLCCLPWVVFPFSLCYPPYEYSLNGTWTVVHLSIN